MIQEIKELIAWKLIGWGFDLLSDSDFKSKLAVLMAKQEGLGDKKA